MLGGSERKEIADTFLTGYPVVVNKMIPDYLICEIILKKKRMAFSVLNTMFNL